MKVYVGKYPNNYWSCHDFFEDIVGRRHGKEYGYEVDEENYGRIDRAIMKFSTFWQGVLNLTVNKIVRHSKRKISIRIDSHDTWGMDTTLALIILPMLKQLKATKHGSPWVDDEDVPHLVKKKKKTKKKSELDEEEDQYADVVIRWDWVMEEMIWAFEQIVDPDEGREKYYIPYKEGEEVDRLSWVNSDTGEKHYFLSEEEQRKMGRYDSDLHKEHQDRVSRGLRFFGKYYQSLWD